MRRVMSGQLDVSRKLRVRRRPVQVLIPAGRPVGSHRKGTLWERKMRTLALRLPKGRVRRDRSGAPMKRS